MERMERHRLAVGMSSASVGRGGVTGGKGLIRGRR